MKKLLNIRWVCAVCLKIIYAPLKVRNRWIGNQKYKKWSITSTQGPRCHKRDMLLAGEPKIDLWGLSGRVGAIIDPVDNLRMPA